MKNFTFEKRIKILLSFLLSILFLNVYGGEGSKQTTPDTNHRASLAINNSTYGSFGRYGSTDAQRLYIRIQNPNSEKVYLGFSRARRSSPTGTEITSRFRIMRPDGSVAFANYNLDGSSSNITGTEAQRLTRAQNGPNGIDGVTSAGYTPIVFNPNGMPAGDYYIEFESTTDGSSTEIYYNYYDITVANTSNNSIPGRIYSKRWAFAMDDVETDFNGAFYVFAPDNGSTTGAVTQNGFVNKINFNGAGFRPWYFNVAFNNTGPGNSGNAANDQKSIYNAPNATQMSPKYEVFLNDPDINIWKNGTYNGNIQINGITNCGIGESNINISVFKSGTIEILLDFNGGDGIYTPGTKDVLTTQTVTASGAPPYAVSVPWNGKDGLGNTIAQGTSIPIVVTFGQAAFHFPIYDVEENQYGFSCTTVRPAAPSGYVLKFYWDDSNITYTGGTFDAKVNLTGCTPNGTPPSNCHRWNGFNDNNNGSPQYGNLNTINTWWYANRDFVTSNIVLPPFYTVALGTTSNVTCFGGNDGKIQINVTNGTGPFKYYINGETTVNTLQSLTAGTYNIKVVDANGCSANINGVVITQPAAAVTVAKTSQTDVLCFGASTGAINITASGGVGPYTYDWTDLTGTTDPEDRTGLIAGTYTVTVKDSKGCTSAPLVVTITQSGSAVASAKTSQTDVLCFGASTGAINITASGGVAPYTYDWADLAGTNDPEDRTALPAGTYTVTVKDANGCAATPLSVTITQPAYAVASAKTSQTDVLCFGASTGAINITASGGVAPYTYDWADLVGANDPEDRTALPAGTYTVTVKDANGCAAAPLSVTITQPASAVAVAKTSQTDVLCFGASTGAINITASGGVAPYTYDWADLAGTNDPEDRTALPAGTYTVTVKDANGCSAAPLAVTITQPASAVAVAKTSQTDVLCFGASTGAINITASGGLAPYTYDWADLAGTNDPEDRTALIAGTYTVTVKDANGCSEAPLAVTITQPASAVAVAKTSQTDVLCFGASTGAINITASGGVAPYSYDWADLAGTNDPEDRTALIAGTYTVTVKDANGCSAAPLAVTITQPASAVAVAKTSQTDVLCFGASTGAINITASGGVAPYTYDWADLAGTNDPEDRTALPAGTYTVTVKDANGCSAAPLSVTITQPASAVAVAKTSQTDVLCFGASTGAINITASGGVAPYTYDWADLAGTNDPEDRTALIAGTYTVTVKDANGCSAAPLAVTITQPASAVAVAKTSQTDVLCFGASTGAINITASGGVAPYTYDWADLAGTNDPEDRTALPAGTYTVTVKDANGCSAAPLSVTITQPASAVAVAKTSQTDVLCFGASTGAINITASGGVAPYTYDWADLAGTNDPEDRTGLIAGTYTVTIKDVNGCSAAPLSVTITQPASAVASAKTSQTDVLCFGASTGAINITASGGVAPYTYDWADLAGTNDPEDRTALPAGTYTVTVKDANGCSAAPLSVTITQPASAVASAKTSQTDVLCFGASTGAINITASGGVAPYTYDWADLAGTNDPEDRTALITGTYTVTVKDANGCAAAPLSITITQPGTALSCSVVQNKPVTSNGLSNGEATVSPIGGTPTYTYLWDNGENTPKAVALNAGTHSVKVTDANGCTTECSIVITEPNVLSCSIAQDATVKCYGGNTGKATVTAVGGNGEYTYLWDNGETTAQAVALTAGLHSVTVTDKLGYSTKCEITIGQPQALLSATTTQVNVACGGGATGSATVIPSGGTSPYTYSWDTNPVQTDATAIGLKAGTYNVTVTDANLCTIVKTAIIIDGDSVIPVIDPLPAVSTINCPAEPVFAQATATDDNGTISSLTYEDTTTEGNCAGTYTKTRTWTAKDACGNVSLPVSQTIIVQDNSAPTWTTQAGSLDKTIECSDEQALANAQSLFPTASDLCDTDVSNIIKVSGQFVASEGCGNAGTYTNTWTVKDDCGNTSETFTQIITIQDTTAPTWTTQAGSLDKTIECSDEQALANAQSLFPTASDLCDTDVSNIIKVSGQFVASEGCGNAGTYTNTWTVKDDCGNTSETFTQIITIQDTTAPTWTTQAGALNATLECSDTEGLAAAQAQFPIASDLCDTDVSNITKVSGQFVASENCSNAGTYTNTWTVKDDCGNTSETFTQIITIQDTMKPAFVGELPSDITVSCDAVPEPYNMQASDNCNGDLPIVFSETKSDIKNECGTEYTLTRNWSTSDCGGNSISYTQIITVRDTTPPTGTAPADVANLQNAADIPAGSPEDIKDATDNCGGTVNITVNDTNNGATGCNGESYILTRTYTLTDCAGNKTELVQTFTVENKVSVSGIPTNVSCQGESNGSIAVTSSPGATVVITNQNNEVVGNTNLPAGTYTLTATSVVNGENQTCTATATVVITEPNYRVKISGQIINVNTNAPIANVPVTLIPQGTTTGPIQMRITGADGMYSFTGMPAGSYLVQVQDANLNSAYQLYPVDSSLFFTTLEECAFQVHNFEYGKSNLPVLGDYVWYDLNNNGIQDEWYDANNDGVVTKNIPDSNGSIDYSQWEWIDLNGDGSYTGPQNNGELNAAGFGNALNANVIIDGPNGYHEEVIVGIEGFWRDRPDTANPYGDYTIKLVRDANFDAVAAALGATGLVKVLPSISSKNIAAKTNKMQLHTVCKTTTDSGYVVTVTPEDLVHLDADFGVSCKDYKDIVANDDSAGPIAGVNHITTNVLNVLPNDTLEGNAITASDVIITTVTPNEFLQLNPDGSVDVLPNAPVGTLTMVYQICEADQTDNCDTATVTVTIEAPIMTVTATSICVNDVPYIDYVVTAVNFTPLNGVSIAWADSNSNVVTTMNNLPLSGRVLWPGAVVDEQGKGIDWPGWIFENNRWIEGADGFEKLRPTTNVTFTVNPSQTITINYPPADPYCTARPTFAIVANDDTPAPIIESPTQTTVGNVLTNDTLNSSSVNINDVTLTTTIPDPTGSISVNPDGTISVAPNTPGGTYTLTYQICEKADFGNCDTAIVTVTVISPIVANDDTFSNIGCNSFGLVGNLLSNDVKGRTPITIDLVNFTLIAQGNTTKTDPNITVDSSGNVNVSSLTVAGTYTYSYTICDKLNPENCDSAIVTIIVIPNGAIEVTGTACNDDSTLVNLSSLLPEGSPTTGVWQDRNNTNALQGGILNPFGLALGNYVFEYVIADQNCPRTVVLNMEINDDCKVLACGNVLVHNAFSPNGDNMNDFFKIDNIDELTCYPGNTVEIYNRWGILVFETTNYNNKTNAFDGTSRGRTTVKQSDGLPTGTYFYIITYKSLDGNNNVQDHKLDGYLYLSR
ncbi:gliding motility-associated C-terminal domain-containing protein [Flavobacterium humidisoli]|uniref:Gliding motility-associated C-terminal domain-containing protein n=1 Tax=Flavobacterium humidisoli TaxID=2937442 RepID=A0ABY4LRJ6_9FLAO|nr:gliding motility-associated C-terminal domain-containing protein [Flavobacterium humidisoli]UPZ15228.1 gliding motility-associated C-terminal domain-containing protein [Flavobacterium humidisoli]